MDRHLDDRIDAALADTFPASDPPFFMAGTGVVGSPHSAAQPRNGDEPHLPDRAGSARKAKRRR